LKYKLFIYKNIYVKRAALLHNDLKPDRSVELVFFLGEFGGVTRRLRALLFCAGFVVVSHNDFLVLRQYGLLDHIPRFTLTGNAISR
jgi:hypothetical protein